MTNVRSVNFEAGSVCRSLPASDYKFLEIEI